MIDGGFLYVDKIAGLYELGAKHERQAIARRLQARGIDPAIIAEVTGL